MVAVEAVQAEGMFNPYTNEGPFPGFASVTPTASYMGALAGSRAWLLAPAAHVSTVETLRAGVPMRVISRQDRCIIAVKALRLNGAVLQCCQGPVVCRR